MFIPGLYLILFCYVQSAKRLIFFISYCVTVSGAVLVGVSLACLKNNIYGVPNCHANHRFRSVVGTMLGILVLLIGGLLFAWARARVRYRIQQIMKRKVVWLGCSMFVIGIALVYGGWFCLEDLLECEMQGELDAGTVWFSIGPWLIGMGYYIVFSLFFYVELGDDWGKASTHTTTTASEFDSAAQSATDQPAP